MVALKTEQLMHSLTWAACPPWWQGQLRGWETLMVWAWVRAHPCVRMAGFTLLAVALTPPDEEFCSHGWWENSWDKQLSRHQGPGDTQPLYLWKAEPWVTTQRFQLFHLHKVDPFHEHLFECHRYLVTCISTTIYLTSKHTWLHCATFHLGWRHLIKPSLDLANK